MRNFVLICVGVAALATVLSGQGTTASEEEMRALVAEMRGLRADLNRVAGTGIRVQLLAGRLQLQEERILTVSRQLTDVQNQIAGEVQGRARIEADIARSEEAQNIPADKREEHERHLKYMRRELALRQPREHQLRVQESSLSALLADEQARWTEFSSRLDELERALTATRDRY